MELSINPNINNIINITPKERLMQLQELYNSMEFHMDTTSNRMRCNCYMDEINEIIKIYPELINEVKLKNYGF